MKKDITLRIKMMNDLTDDQFKQIDQLWNQLYPVNLNNRFVLLLADIKEYKHYLLIDEANEITGWAVAFTRNEETWFSILVAATFQKQGYGKMLINRLKQDCNALSGWVIDHNNDFTRDGSSYYTPIQFYLKNDFIATDIRLETDIISAVKIRWQE
jgi:GNAT superfamily N-acetyltransferase